MSLPVFIDPPVAQAPAKLLKSNNCEAVVGPPNDIAAEVVPAFPKCDLGVGLSCLAAQAVPFHCSTAAAGEPAEPQTANTSVAA